MGKEKDAAKWLAGYRVALRANRQVAIALREQDMNAEADHFSYRSYITQRMILRREGYHLKWLESWALQLLAGYGYRFLFTLGWYVALNVAFSSVYWAASQHTAHPLLLWDAVALSLTAFHGRGFFPIQIPFGEPWVFLLGFEALLGLVVEASIIATFTQRYFGR